MSRKTTMEQPAGRGRPIFKPTNAQRQLVAESAGGGMSQEAIARTLKIDAKTLVKHFGDELTLGANKKRQEVLRAMFKAAKKGNVAAARFYLALPIQSDTLPDQQPGIEVPIPSTQQTVADGKKAQANVNAVTAQIGTEWENLLPPPRVM